MEKLKTFLMSINVTTTIFVLIGLRVTFFGAGIGEALCISSFCAIQGLAMWLNSKVREPVNAELRQEVADIRAHMSALVMKNSVKPPMSPGEKPTMPRFF